MLVVYIEGCLCIRLERKVKRALPSAAVCLSLQNGLIVSDVYGLQVAQYLSHKLLRNKTH